MTFWLKILRTFLFQLPSDIFQTSEFITIISRQILLHKTAISFTPDLKPRNETVLLFCFILNGVNFKERFSEVVKLGNKETAYVNLYLNCDDADAPVST